MNILSSLKWSPGSIVFVSILTSIGSHEAWLLLSFWNFSGLGLVCRSRGLSEISLLKRGMSSGGGCCGEFETSEKDSYFSCEYLGFLERIMNMWSERGYYSISLSLSF